MFLNKSFNEVLNAFKIMKLNQIKFIKHHYKLPLEKEILKL